VNGQVSRKAPAKLNLTLAVLGRRTDGFHDLHSVMVPLALADTVTLAVAAGIGKDTLRVMGVAGTLRVTPDNLVLQAIAATRRAVRTTWPGAPESPPLLTARLSKRIPVAAGLGGGSSDAAAALDAALDAWGATLPRDVARSVAASIGSDVPFFLAGGAALVTGRGEHVEPLPPFRGVAPAVLLVTPQLQVPTRAVFAAYAAGARSPGGSARVLSERLTAGIRNGMTAEALAERAADLVTANDLLPAALVVVPRLGEFRQALSGLLGLPVGQSGSGPTAWVLCPSLSAARKAAALVRQSAASALPQLGDGPPFVAATSIVSRAQ
jgi:4-diphosphocytidyl-2-C-methyl-D-erythritol kinase